MKLKDVVDIATDKDNFLTISDYTNFCLMYLEFIKTELQAVIVSKNETHYRFFQYKQDGTYNVTRPINSNLMLSLEHFESCQKTFKDILANIKSKEAKQEENRKLLNDYIYTCQQSIGAALDALPSNRSNTARKINGDLFERYIRLIIKEVGVDVSSGTICVPVKVNGNVAFSMSYQHDLIIKVDDATKAIGSVKTSSKDRLDKIFIDKFLHNKLTDTETPHFAIFLNDVQRTGKEGKYGINSTFLPGHFKGYTIKLNPLDGVYYFDIRPNMTSENILKDQIKTFDNFLIHDVWKFHGYEK
ncbi:MAG: hypothetical protein K9K75_02955 [Deltaproteobacteria bacterium]|nr:hypothetical protein [Deltaproteobacteria bacterium]